MALLSTESLQRIEREAAKYPPEQRQSAVMSALAIAQDQHGWLSNEVMEEVAKVLRMPPVCGLRGGDLLRHVQPQAHRQAQGRPSAPTCRARSPGGLEAAEHLKQQAAA